MNSLAFATDVAAAHAPMVQRAAAIIAGIAQDEAVDLRDASDQAPLPSGPCIVLARGPVPMLRRAGGKAGGTPRRYQLTYTDPNSEVALGALLACAAPIGAPIAADPESLSVLALAERLAISEIPVLINGPTGTGKEVLSRFIHDRSPRKAGPFVAINCAAMPEAMLEALLFGHVKGAFTGATGASEGFFRAADGGTLLLDEIAELPLPLQAKLLRALQEGEVVPIGSTKPIPVDVRIIAAANRDLPTEVAEGRFRADLYYRLNVFPLSLRPLRERAEDIAPLAFAMLLRHAAPDAAVPWISEAALDLLKQHGWPGNVRELENVMRRALLLSENRSATRSEIGPEHIHFDQPARLVLADSAAEPTALTATNQAHGTAKRLANIVQISEARAIMETLSACGGSRIAAARQLGISERTLRYRLAAFREAGLSVESKNAYAGARG